DGAVGEALAPVHAPVARACHAHVVRVIGPGATGRAREGDERHGEDQQAVSDGSHAASISSYGTGRYSRSWSFARRRSSSRYSQTSVTRSAKAPYHSIYRGAPRAALRSMRSKSSTRLNAATPTTTTLNAIPTAPLEWMSGTCAPKSPPTKLARYTSPIPAVAAKMPRRRLSVTRTRPER